MVEADLELAKREAHMNNYKDQWWELRNHSSRDHESASAVSKRLVVAQKAIKYADFVYKMTKEFSCRRAIRFNQPVATVCSIGVCECCGGVLPFFQGGHGTVHRNRFWVAPESVTSFEIAKRQQFLSPATCGEAYGQAETLSKMLSGFCRTLKGKKNPNRV